MAQHKSLNRLDTLQTIAVSDALRKVCETRDGFAVYAEGFDDLSIAKSMGFVCTPANVAGVRKPLFGHLRPPASASVPDRLSTLEKAFKGLCGELNVDPAKYLSQGA